jgi:hypothetical protein
MADNTTLNTGTGGDVIATDDVSGVKYPRSKVTLGADGANDGDVSATNPMPIKGTGTAGTPNAGVVTVQGAASMTPVQVGDNSGSLTVDAPVGTPVFVRLSDGSAAIPTLPVSAASLPLPSGAATAAKQPALGTAGTPSADVISIQGAPSMTAVKVDGSAVTQPVSLASALPVTDNGGSLTVDGSVSVSGVVPGVSATSLGKSEDAVAADGDTGVAVWAVRKDTAATTVGADGDYHPFEVDGNGRLWVNASSVNQPVTDAGGSLTVDNGGTFAVQVDGAALTSLQLIDNVVLLEDAASANGDPGVQILSVRKDTAAATSGTDGDYQPLITDANGRLHVNVGNSSIPITDNSGSLTVDNAGTFAVQDSPATSGGLSIYSFLSTAVVQAAQIKGSAGQVYALHFFNLNAAAVYVRLYNLTGTPGTGDTVVYRALVPGNTAGAGFVVPIPPGVAFGTGIGIRVSGAIADNDATALSANTVLGNVFYK